MSDTNSDRLTSGRPFAERLQDAAVSYRKGMSGLSEMVADLTLPPTAPWVFPLVFRILLATTGEHGSFSFKP